MTAARSGIKSTGPIIAAAVGDRSFTVRDVPGVSPQTLAKLAKYGYLIIVCKAQVKGGSMRNYHPATYRLNVAHKRVRDLLEVV
jgi:hypothetical protein